MAKTNQNKNKTMRQGQGARQSASKGFTSMGYSNNNQDPKFSNSSGGTIIKHRELIELVASQTQFNVAQKRINPADKATFPWLSAVAGKYEKYRFRKLKLQMVPHAPTTASGTLGMYIDYDPSDVPAPNASAFFSSGNAVTSQIWLETSVTAKPQTMQLFNQDSIQMSDLEIKWFDYARIFFYMQSPGANGAHTAWLFVDYEIELFTPTASVEGASYTPDFSGFAYWTTAQSGPAFTNAPTILRGMEYVFEDDEAKLTVPFTGYYKITTLTANTNSGASVSEIFESPTCRIINGLDGEGNPTTREQTVIVQLQQGETYVPLRMTTGTLDLFADPDNDPSPLGVEVVLLQAS
nr:structural protein [Tolivirales sp. gcode 6]